MLYLAVFYGTKSYLKVGFLYNIPQDWLYRNMTFVFCYNHVLEDTHMGFLRLICILILGAIAVSGGGIGLLIVVIFLLFLAGLGVGGKFWGFLLGGAIKTGGDAVRDFRAERWVGAAISLLTFVIIMYIIFSVGSCCLAGPVELGWY